LSGIEVPELMQSTLVSFQKSLFLFGDYVFSGSFPKTSTTSSVYDM